MEAQAAKPKGLAAKMAAAMGEIGRVKKRGQNQAQGYSYARADDVAEMAREVLAKHGIAVFADVTDHGVREIEGRNGKIRITWAKVAWTFVDSESGENRTVNVPGEGQDSGDKGIYKAMTGSMKYALMTGFLIPTGEGDPEVENEQDREDTSQSRGPAPRPQRNGRTAPSSPETRKADLKARMVKAGVQGAHIPEKLGEWLGRPVDGSTVISVDDWMKADAGIEQITQAADALARSHTNGAN